MADLIWFNGEVLPIADVRVDVEDRGFQFADGVYEVIRLYDGRPFAFRAHLDRLRRSAEGIHVAPPLDDDVLASEVRRLVDRSGVRDGTVYMQLTRGVAPRNHVFPAAPA